MERKKFIKFLGLLGLSMFMPLKAKSEDYSYGTTEYPIRTRLNREAFRISSLGIFADGKLIHKIPVRNFKIKRGDKLTIIWEIENSRVA